MPVATLVLLAVAQLQALATAHPPPQVPLVQVLVLAMVQALAPQVLVQDMVQALAQVLVDSTAHQALAAALAAAPGPSHKSYPISWQQVG